MATNIPDLPVAAVCYIYQPGDSIAATAGTADAGAPFALSNIIEDPSLLRQGRTTTAATGEGFVVTLATEITAFCVEVVDFGSGNDPVGVDTRIVVRNSGAAITLDNGVLGHVSRTPEIFTDHSLEDPVSVRYNLLAGYDTTDTPTASSPGEIGSGFAAKTIQVTFIGTGASYWETAYLAIGVVALQVSSVQLSGRIQTGPAELRHGSGYEATTRWSSLPMTDAEYLLNLWTASQSGESPIFWFPAPGAKDSSGVLSEPEQNPASRGGLVRLVRKPEYKQSHPQAGIMQASDVTFAVQSWQEFPAL